MEEFYLRWDILNEGVFESVNRSALCWASLGAILFIDVIMYNYNYMLMKINAEENI